MTEGAQRLHAQIYGGVQGVSFRYYTVLAAQEIGVTGWVRNLDDGSVEAVAEGTPGQLRHLLDFLRRGPSAAQVSKVDVNWLQSSAEFSDFHIR
jgi:acylphosphatase